MDERSSSKKISPIVGRKLPEFVQDQHETFVAFIKAYFEWLEQQDNAADTISSLRDNGSIDTTPEKYIEFFRRQYLETIPAETLSDKRLLVKHIKEYYRAKGTEQSIKFLFQILFNETPELYYPTYDLLRASDGKWQQDIVIRTNNAAVDYDLLNSKVMVGQTSGARALIESSDTFTSANGQTIREFILNTSSIKGTFTVGESLTILRAESETGLIVKGSIVEPTITSGGTGYEKGDVFYIRDATSNQNIIGTGSVKTISTTGAITKVKLETFPVDEISLIGAVVDFTDSGDGNATGTINVQAKVTYPGRWLNDDSKLSMNKRLQDNHFWQDYSYQIRSSVPIDSYFDLLQKAVHPAGMLAFAEVVSNDISSGQALSMQMQSYISVIIETVAQKLSMLMLSETEMEIAGLSDMITTYLLTYNDIAPQDLHGYRYRPINDNPYYIGLQNKSPSDLLTPPIPVGFGLYTPGSLLETAIDTSGNITITSSMTLGKVAAAASTTIQVLFSGSAAATLAPLSISASAALNFSASATPLLGSVTIAALATVPASLTGFAFAWQQTFEGADGATTTPNDIIGGASCTMNGNAVLTTTSPLEGTSSYLGDGVNASCSTPQNAAIFAFGASSFAIHALIHPFSTAAAGCIMTVYRNANSFRSWRWVVSSTGEIRFDYSTNGTGSTSVTSPAGTIVAGNDYECLVTRDTDQHIRIYVDGVMVVKSPSPVTGTFFAASIAPRVGAGRNSANSGDETIFNGRIDDVRVVKGSSPDFGDAGYTP
jgi:hypothetical protein